MLLGMGVANVPRHEENLEGSLTFTEEAQLLITGNHYVIPYEINVTLVIEPLLKTREYAKDLSRSFKRMNNGSVIATLGNAISSFEIEVNHLFDDFLNYLEYRTSTSPLGAPPMRHQRRKRGALDIVGSLTNALFGVATQSQVDLIHDRLGNLEELTEQERDMLNVHSKLLNINVRKMTVIEAALIKLKKASSLAHSIIDELNSNTLALEIQTRMIESLLALQISLSDIRSDIINVKLGLDKMIQMELSPYIMPSDILLDALSEASLRTPGLLYPARSEFLSLYRDTIHVISRPTNIRNIFFFYLLVPLRGNPGDMFDVFRINALPFRIPNSSHYLQTHLSAKFLAISEDRNTYSMYDDFTMCRNHGSLFVCPPLGPLYDTTVLNCEVSVFLERPESDQLCPTVILKDFVPVFHQTKTGWTFSTPRPIQFTFNCPGGKLHKHRETIHGTGTIVLGQGCSAHSSMVTLPSIITYSSRQQLQILPRQLPSNFNLTLPKAKRVLRLLQEDSHFDKSSGPVSVDDLLHQLHMVRRSPPPSTAAHSWPSWAALSVGCVIVAAVLACVVRRRGRLCHYPRTYRGYDVGAEAACTCHDSPPGSSTSNGPRGHGQSERGVCGDTETVTETIKHRSLPWSVRKKIKAEIVNDIPSLPIKETE